MLHINGDIANYYRKLDENFKTTPKMSYGISVEVEKIYEDIENTWDKDIARVNKGLKSFETKLMRAVSVPIPAKYVGKRRPALRKFPFYMAIRPPSATGEHLKDSWYMNTSVEDGDNSKTLTADYGFTSPHARYTNDGWRSTRPVHWLHWADKVLNASLPVGTLHSAKVPDIRAVLLGRYGKSW